MHVAILAKKMLIDENSENDWYRPRKGLLDRCQLLAVAFVAKDIIRPLPTSKCVSKCDFKESLDTIRQTGCSFVDDLEGVSWDTIRNCSKSMCRKYQMEKSHDSFNSYIALARTLWRQ